MDLPAGLDAFYGALVGMALGSYLGAFWWRLRNRRTMSGRSHCPGCGVILPAGQMIPIFSWLALRGRARCCGAPLSAAYLLFELLSACAGTLAGLRFGIFATLCGSAVIIALAALACWLRATGDERCGE